jgi:hypothetical protein
MKHSDMTAGTVRSAPDGMAAGYESHYLRAVDPARPRGAWIRHTSHQRPGEAPTGALWCTVWDAEAGPPYAVKQSLTTPSQPATPERFVGRAEAAGRAAAWDLEAASGQAGLRHLPRAWMYRAPLPRTKPESPMPDAVFAGSIEIGGRSTEAAGLSTEAAGLSTEATGWSTEVGERSGEAGGRRIEVAGWRGVVGHNWGSEHAERWVWLQALGFAEAPGAWLDVTLGRIRVAGRTTPWVANGAVELDGSRLRVGGLGRVRSTRVDARPGALEAVIGGAAATIRVSVAAPLDQTVAFVYADPHGGEHHALNCSIAQVRLRVERPGRPPVELATAFGGAYELGVRETDHGVPVQPFPDP